MASTTAVISIGKSGSDGKLSNSSSDSLNIVGINSVGGSVVVVVVVVVCVVEWCIAALIV